MKAPRWVAKALLAGLATSTLGTASVHASVPSKKTQTEFSSACFQAYSHGRSEAPLELGKRICDCAGPEAKSQGASEAVLKRETAALVKDTKHQFQDTHVLDAMKYCTITAFEALDDH